MKSDRIETDAEAFSPNDANGVGFIRSGARDI
jgi:hypothetical protein